MILEDDAEQVVDFAFHPVSGGPNARYGFYSGFCGCIDFQTDALIRRYRIKVINNFKGSFLIGEMNASYIGQIIERRLVVGSKRLANFADSRSINTQRELP